MLTDCSHGIQTLPHRLDGPTNDCDPCPQQSFTILTIVLDSIRPILVEVFDTVTSLDLMVGERIVDPPHHFGRTVVNLHHMI